MSAPLIFDRVRLRDLLEHELRTVLAPGIARRVAGRAVAELERAALPEPPPAPTELERARAREIARRAGLRVRETR